MPNFIKLFSFFVIYLPALIFACQFSYYTGIAESIGLDISSLGMNYAEVTFMGYMNISVDILKIITNILWFIIFLVIYLILLLLLHWLAVHPSARQDEKHHFSSIKHYLKYEWPTFKAQTSISLSKFSSVALIYFFLFLFTLLLISIFFKKGQQEITNTVNNIFNTTSCTYEMAYVTQNNTLTLVQPLLCGHYKCIGIDIKNKTAITYLPETYTKVLTTYRVGSK